MGYFSQMSEVDKDKWDQLVDPISLLCVDNFGKNEFCILSELMIQIVSEQFARTPVEAEFAASCTLTTAFQEIGVKPDAVHEVAELCVGCAHDFALAIEKCICMDLDGCVGVNVLEEPFELNGCRQVIVLFGDAADEEDFRLISRQDFYLGKENCYGDHLLR